MLFSFFLEFVCDVVALMVIVCYMCSGLVAICIGGLCDAIASVQDVDLGTVLQMFLIPLSLVLVLVMIVFCVSEKLAEHALATLREP